MDFAELVLVLAVTVYGIIAITFVTLNWLRPIIESIKETGYIKASHVIRIIDVFAYEFFLAFLVVFLKTSDIEAGEKYEVLRIKGENVICVDSDDKTVIYPLYDICYDENAEKMYAVEMSMQRDVTLGIFKKRLENIGLESIQMTNLF